MKRLMMIMVVATGIGCGLCSVLGDTEDATYFGVMCLLFLYFHDDIDE